MIAARDGSRQSTVGRESAAVPAGTLGLGRTPTAEELAAWNKNRKHDASLKRIRAQMASVCAKLPAADPARAACDGALRPAKA